MNLEFFSETKQIVNSKESDNKGNKAVTSSSSVKEQNFMRGEFAVTYKQPILELVVTNLEMHNIEGFNLCPSMKKAFDMLKSSFPCFVGLKWKVISENGNFCEINTIKELSHSLTGLI